MSNQKAKEPHYKHLGFAFGAVIYRSKVTILRLILFHRKYLPLKYCMKYSRNMKQ
jgi:hypothetical protein